MQIISVTSLVERTRNLRETDNTIVLIYTKKKKKTLRANQYFITLLFFPVHLTEEQHTMSSFLLYRLLSRQ